MLVALPVTSKVTVGGVRLSRIEVFSPSTPLSR